MLTWILEVAAAYVVFGHLFGRLNWWVFNSHRRGPLRYLLFPWDALLPRGAINIAGGAARGTYFFCLTLLWPLKVVWSAVFCTLFILPMLVKMARARNFATPKNGARAA